MKVKKEYIALFVIIVALVAYLALRQSDRSLYELPQLASIDTKEITRIELASSKGTIAMIKAGSEWTITPENYPADSQKAKEMLAVLEDLTLTELISESKNYQRYHLGSTEGIVVKCWAKDKLKREMTIGKSADSHNHTFVKLPGDDAVYQAKGDFRRKFDMEKGAFRDKSVLTFDQKEIAEIVIQTEEDTGTYTKEAAPETAGTTEETQGGAAPAPPEPKWINIEGAEADTTKISSLISTLSNLKCEEFQEGKTKTDHTAPVFTLTLKGVKNYSLSIFPEIKKEDESFFPAVSSENDHPFLLSKWRAENIMKKPADLLKKSDGEE